MGDAPRVDDDRPTALFLSPHLDDVAFSCGGTAAALGRAGWRLVVATVFTASMPAPTGFALACQLDKNQITFLSAVFWKLIAAALLGAVLVRHASRMASEFSHARDVGYHAPVNDTAAAIGGAAGKVTSLAMRVRGKGG